MKVGKQTIIHTAQFLCPLDSFVSVDFKVLGAPITVEFRFKEDHEVEGKKIRKDGFENGIASILLINWEKGLGGCVTPFPWKFAEVGGRALSLAGTGQGISGIYSAFFQFMLEDDK